MALTPSLRGSVGACCLLVAALAVAGHYRWVDDQGRVIYGDTPPPDQEVRELSVDEGPTDQEREAARLHLQLLLEEQQQRRTSRQEAREKARNEQDAERQEKAIRHDRCELARTDLRTLQLGARVYWRNAQGERVYLNDETRKSEIQRMKDEIKTFCE